jgi:hypothetical protein
MIAPATLQLRQELARFILQQALERCACEDVESWCGHAMHPVDDRRSVTGARSHRQPSARIG